MLPEQSYKFYLTAVSPGGVSSVSLASVYTGDTEAINVNIETSAPSTEQGKFN